MKSEFEPCLSPIFLPWAIECFSTFWALKALRFISMMCCSIRQISQSDFVHVKTYKKHIAFPFLIFAEESSHSKNSQREGWIAGEAGCPKASRSHKGSCKEADETGWNGDGNREPREVEQSRDGDVWWRIFPSWISCQTLPRSDRKSCFRWY